MRRKEQLLGGQGLEIGGRLSGGGYGTRPYSGVRMNRRGEIEPPKSGDPRPSGSALGKTERIKKEPTPGIKGAIPYESTTQGPSRPSGNKPGGLSHRDIDRLVQETLERTRGDPRATGKVEKRNQARIEAAHAGPPTMRDVSKFPKSVQEKARQQHAQRLKEYNERSDTQHFAKGGMVKDYGTAPKPGHLGPGACGYKRDYGK